MKTFKNIFRLVALTAALVIVFNACKKDDDGVIDGGVEQTGWVAPTETAFQFSMTLQAQIAQQETVLTNPANEIAAFCGNQCRGKAHVVFDKALNRYLCNLTIYSNAEESETIEIKVFVAEHKKIYDNCLSFPFQSNLSMGGCDHLITLP